VLPFPPLSLRSLPISQWTRGLVHRAAATGAAATGAAATGSATEAAPATGVPEPVKHILYCKRFTDYSCRLLWCCQSSSPIEPSFTSSSNDIHGRFIFAFMTKGRQSCLYLFSLQAQATVQNTHSPATSIGTPRPSCTRSFKAIQSSALQMHRTSRHTFPLPLQALGRHGATRTSSDTPKSCRKFHRSSIMPPALPLHQKRSDTRSDSQIPRC
jgi:hypothetical protein